MVSPFTTHKNVILGHYSTAAFLRMVVMSMWNGTDYKVGLSQVASLDEPHYKVFQDILRQYREKGEMDPAFIELAQAIRERMATEAAEAERVADMDDWFREVKRALRSKKLPTSLLDERSAWFEEQFEAGKTADEAAQLVIE